MNAKKFTVVMTRTVAITLHVMAEDLPGAIAQARRDAVLSDTSLPEEPEYAPDWERQMALWAPSAVIDGHHMDLESE